MILSGFWPMSMGQLRRGRKALSWIPSQDASPSGLSLDALGATSI